MVVGISHIVTMVTFVALICGASKTEWQAWRPLGYAGAALAWLSFLASDRYRRALRREGEALGRAR